MAVKLFGHEVKTPALVAIVGGSGLAIWFAYKQHKASAGTSTSASAIDPLTGLPASQDNQVDPLTGEAYLAEAQQYGSVSAAENAVAGESSLAYSSAYGTGGGLAGTSTGASLEPATTVQGTSYATNAAWAQAVEAGLTDIGYASTDVSAALGRYLGSLSETPAQATIVQAAIAEYGPPPVGSYQVIMAPATGSTGSGPGGTGTSAPKAAGAISGLKVTGYDQTGASFEWDAAAGATQGYGWQLTSTNGQGITKSGSTDSTHVSVTGLDKPGVYNFGVQALPGGKGDNIHTPSLKG